jgi:hypothetical protein
MVNHAGKNGPILNRDDDYAVNLYAHRRHSQDHPPRRFWVVSRTSVGFYIVYLSLSFIEALS